MFFCRLLIFFKINFLKNSFRFTIRVANSLNPDQTRHFFGPDLGPNCLQRLSADDTSRKELKRESVKAAYSVTMNIFRKILFSF